MYQTSENCNFKEQKNPNNQKLKCLFNNEKNKCLHNQNTVIFNN